jgi:hypothetical protein
MLKDAMVWTDGGGGGYNLPVIADEVVDALL